jgi:beta-glucanase (GH16 family)
MKKSLFTLVVLFPVLSWCQTNTQTEQVKGEKLIWSDEFDYSGLPDPQKWGYEKGFVRNNEAQYYTSERLKNARVEDGKLIITACKEEYEGAHYTSASINTKGKYEFTRGRIEVKAKLPHGKGTWPAIWTLGKNIGEVGWPACGEIDIMEFVGFEPDVVYANVHTKDYNHTKGTGRGGKIITPRPYEDFHIYAVEWYNDRLDFYFDDQKYFTCMKKGEGIGEWPFDAPQYLLINLAIGGAWGGQKGIDDSIFPMEYQVEYVRIYQK